MNPYTPTTIHILNPYESYNLYYGEWGKNNRHTVICLHGLTRNSRDFDYIANALAEAHFRVICVDLVGRGQSSWLKNKDLYNYSTYCKSIIYLIKSLNLKKVNIIGTSLGGIIAMYLAEYMPSLCNKIVLNDIGPFMDAASREIIAKYINFYPQFADRQSALKYLKSLLKPFGIKKDEHWQHLIYYSFIINKEGKYVLAFDPAISQNFNDSVKISPELDLWETWNNIPISIPILLIRGELSKVLPKETAEKMLTSRPNMDYLEFKEVGHTPALLESEQINPIVNWLLT